MSRRRAYRPAQSTFDLRDRVARLGWVLKVEIEAPHHGPGFERPARFLVTDTMTGRRHTMTFEQARRQTGPEPHRCRGLKVDGARCSRFVRSNHQTCWEHR